MALFLEEKEGDKENEKEWLQVLKYITEKRTHEPSFQELFNNILDDKSHCYHAKVSTLAMLYDFTPILPVK